MSISRNTDGGERVDFDGNVEKFHDECELVIRKALANAGLPMRTRILEQDPETGAIKVKAGLVFQWTGSDYYIDYVTHYRQTFHEDEGGNLYFTIESQVRHEEIPPNDRDWELVGDSRRPRLLVEEPLPEGITERSGGIYGSFDTAAGF